MQRKALLETMLSNDKAYQDRHAQEMWSVTQWHHTMIIDMFLSMSINGAQLNKGHKYLQWVTAMSLL